MTGSLETPLVSDFVDYIADHYIKRSDNSDPQKHKTHDNPTSHIGTPVIPIPNRGLIRYLIAANQITKAIGGVSWRLIQLARRKQKQKFREKSRLLSPFSATISFKSRVLKTDIFAALSGLQTNRSYRISQSEANKQRSKPPISVSSLFILPCSIQVRDHDDGR
jgi:hypothetical protein